MSVHSKVILHTHTHTRTHARTHARTHTHTHTHTESETERDREKQREEETEEKKTRYLVFQDDLRESGKSNQTEDAGWPENVENVHIFFVFLLLLVAMSLFVQKKSLNCTYNIILRIGAPWGVAILVSSSAMKSRRKN